MAAETHIYTWVTSQASARQASAQQASARPATMAAEPLQSTKSTNAQHVHQVNKCAACYLQWRPYRLDIYGNSHDNAMLLQE